MPPGKTNQKAQKAIERKEQHKQEKETKVRHEKEKLEEQKWSKGTKDSSKKEELLKKKEDALQKKNEREKLLQEEMDGIKTVKGTFDVKTKRVERGVNKKSLEKERKIEESSMAFRKQAELEEYTAKNIDNALDLLSLTESNYKHEKLDRHPERRAKSAWAAFEERELPLLKSQMPGLRLSQYKNVLQKKWKKSPDNPMNQVNIQYNTTKEEELEMIEQNKRTKLQNILANNETT